jgi:hypothetical protein
MYGRPEISPTKKCGASTGGNQCCPACSPIASGERLVNAAKLGRIATHTPEAKAQRAETMRKHEAAIRAWKPSDLPEWVNQTVYREQVQPRLATVTTRAIMEALQVSKPYAADIRSGKKVPHPRHWQKLAKISGG